VIRKLVTWAESRTYFYWRLRRRLKEFELFARLEWTVNKASSENSTAQARKQFTAELQQFAVKGGVSEEDWENDQILVSWFEQHAKEIHDFVQEKKNQLYVSAVTEKVRKLVQGVAQETSPVDALKSALSALSVEEKALLQQALN
jgi:acetyl-CoA carboxylase/biotin carboxylase 1